MKPKYIEKKYYYPLLARKVQSSLKEIRKISMSNKQSFSLDQPVFTEIRYTQHNHRMVPKLIVFLRGTGCTSIIENGGCTFCGFYSATNHGTKLNGINYLNQIEYALKEHKNEIHQYPVVSIYNDGSMLSEKEIDFSITLEIIKMISSIPSVEKISIESRLVDITSKKIAAIRSVTTKEIEILFGFESSEHTIRRLCVNKNFSNKKVLEVTQLLKSNRILPVALMMMKPPFLTEKEAIEDTIKSFLFLENTSIDRIDLELPTVEKHTLTYHLWRQGFYKPIMLWSVIEVLKKRQELNLQKRLYISPPNYTVASIESSSNCEQCNPIITDLFRQYNSNNDVSVFNGLECSCKESWQNRFYISQLEQKELPTRVDFLLEKVNEGLITAY